MRYALFIGCNIAARVPQYEEATRAVFQELGVGLKDIKEFNCCGYPVRNTDQKGFLLLSARNLALASSRGLDLMILCQCCFGTLKEAQYLLEENSPLREEVNAILRREGLSYEGKVEVKHILQVLYHDVGEERIREKVRRPLEGLKVATHYGCHVLRPSKVTEFDDPFSPSLFDRLVELTGAESVPWGKRLDCCGAPLWGTNDELSSALMRAKVEDARRAGAEGLCVACPYCYLQFDAVQGMVSSAGLLPAILYPQLLGLSMGMEAQNLGIDRNRIPFEVKG